MNVKVSLFRIVHEKCVLLNWAFLFLTFYDLIFTFNAILLAHILDMHQLNYTSFTTVLCNTYIKEHKRGILVFHFYGNENSFNVWGTNVNLLFHPLSVYFHT